MSANKTVPILLLSLLALLLLVPQASAQHGLSGLFQDPARYAPDSWSSSSGGNNNPQWRMGSADPLGLLQTMQALLTGRTSDSAGGHSLLRPEVSVRETASERVYFIEVPGIARNEVTLAVEGGRIVRVVGSHGCTDSPADEYCVERTVEHAILIEHDIEPSKITANHDLAVLRVHMPKKTALRRTIPLVDRLFGLNQPSHDGASRLRVEDSPGTREMPQGAAWVAEPVRDWARDPSRRQEHRATATASTKVENSKETDAAPPVLQRAAAMVRDAATGVWHRAGNLAHRVEDNAGWLAETAVPDMESEFQDTQREWVDRAKEVKDKAGATASSAAARATDSAASVADSVTQAVHRAKDAAQDTVATAAGRAERAAANAKATAGAVADDARQDAANMAHKAQDAAGDAVDDAKDAGWSIWNWADEQAAAVKGGVGGAVEGAREGFHQAQTAERAKHEADQ